MVVSEDLVLIHHMSAALSSHYWHISNVSKLWGFCLFQFDMLQVTPPPPLHSVDGSRVTRLYQMMSCQFIYTESEVRFAHY